MQAFFLQNRSNLGSSKNYRQLFISNKTFSPVLFSICVSIRPSPPHKGSMREQETQCEWEGMSCFQTRLAPPRGLGDVRHRLCPKLPLPLNTHTLAQTHQQNSVSLSKRSTHFLVNILQDLQVHKLFLPLLQILPQNSTLTPVFTLRVVCTLQALRNRTAPRRLRRTCWQR